MSDVGLRSTRVVCPKGDDCALNKGAVTCKHCGRNWPPDETWQTGGDPGRLRPLTSGDPGAVS